MAQNKICRKCGEAKPVSEFGPRKGGKNGLRSRCKACLRKEWKEYSKRPEVEAKAKARKRKGNPKYWRARDLKKNYGISVEDYDGMLVGQRGRCKICGRLPGKRRLTVDHDHETGKIRGLLCGQCNSVIGLARDEPTILRLAALYLEDNK